MGVEMMLDTLDPSNSLADLAARIRSEHEASHAAMQRGCEHAINAGRLLMEAKAQIPHGGWLPWLEEHCQVSERMAQVYMRLAKHEPELAANPQRVADLTVRGAVELLAPPRRASDFPHWKDWAESFDDLDEWAEATTREPFTDYDFDQERPDWLNQSLWKLAGIAGAPAEAVMLLQLGDEHDLPTRNALHPSHIHDLTAAIAPYAKGEKAVEIDAKNPIDVAITIKLAAQCLVGLMFREIEEREGLSPEEVDDRAERLMAELMRPSTRHGRPSNETGAASRSIPTAVAARRGTASGRWSQCAPWWGAQHERSAKSRIVRQYLSGGEPGTSQKRTSELPRGSPY
jgi:hypothetical protein